MDHTISRRNMMAGAAAVVTASATPSAFAQSGQPMVFAGWSHTEAGSKPFLDSVFASFKAANPGIAMETVGVPFGQMETTLLLRKRSGQRTDVAQLQERWLAAFVGAGGLADVDQIFGAKMMDDTFHESGLSMAKVGGKRYGLPWATGSTGLVANGKVLSDVGVTQPPATIDEFLDLLRKVKKAKPNASPYGFTTKNPSLAQLESQLFFWTFGARFFDANDKVAIDSDQARQALSLLADMVKEGLILPGNDRFDFRRLYAQELVALYPDPPLARAFARAQSGKGEDYDRYVLPVPMPVLRTGDQPVSIQWGHLLGFFDHGGARPTVDGPAGLMAKHLISTKNQIDYYKATGVFPATTEAIGALADDKYLVNWLAQTRNSRPDELAVFANGNELRTIIGEEVTAGMLGQKTAAEAIKTMASRLTAANLHR
jgi:multiple sugar transport system substrate-binding protein